MNVLYVNYIHRAAGPLVQIDQFAQAFRRLGHQLTVASLRWSPTAPTRNGHNGVTVKALLRPWLHETKMLCDNMVLFRRESRLVQTEQPDVLLARYKLYYWSYLWSARRAGKPLVLWVDAPGVLEGHRYDASFHRLPGVASAAELYAWRRADRLIVVSEELQQYCVQHGVDASRIRVIPNGVDLERFAPQVDGQALRRRHGLEDSFVVGFVGSFAPWHGMATLERVMEAMGRTVPRLTFVLVGDGPYKARLAERARRNPQFPRTVFLGQLPHAEIPQAIAAMDCCVLPYEAQDFFYFSPLKLFEYLAMGKPVIATSLGQMRRVIHDGAQGFLVPPDDVAAWTARLRQLSGDPALRERMGCAARQTAEAWSWQRCAASVSQLLTEVAETWPRR